MMPEDEVQQRVKKMIVRRLELDRPPGEIGTDLPLFGEGLGLDSVEALELVVGIEEEFEVSIGEAADLKDRLFSVRTIGAFVGELLGAKEKVLA